MAKRFIYIYIYIYIIDLNSHVIKQLLVFSSAVVSRQNLLVKHQICQPREIIKVTISCFYIFGLDKLLPTVISLQRPNHSGTIHRFWENKNAINFFRKTGILELTDQKYPASATQKSFKFYQNKLYKEVIFLLPKKFN